MRSSIDASGNVLMASWRRRCISTQRCRNCCSDKHDAVITTRDRPFASSALRGLRGRQLCHCIARSRIRIVCSKSTEMSNSRVQRHRRKCHTATV